MNRGQHFLSCIPLFLCGVLGFSCTATQASDAGQSRLRHAVYSRDGSAWTYCEGPCPPEIVKEMEAYQPPTAEELADSRQKYIEELRHPKPYACDLPVVPRETFPIEIGGESANLPGDHLGCHSSFFWSEEERRRRPRLRKDEKPVGQIRIGPSLYVLYRLPETKEPVLCWVHEDADSCEEKNIPSKQYDACCYNPKIVVGH